MPRRSINGHSRKRSSAFKKKAIDRLELDREFKRKKHARWYNRGNMESDTASVDAQAEELGNLASTGVVIPPDKAL